MRELNIIQAMKMPIGTEFEAILDGEKYGCSAKIIKSEIRSTKKLVWDNRANSEIVVTDFISDAIFIPIQKPVTFIQAIKANQEGKTIKVTYDTSLGNVECVYPPTIASHIPLKDKGNDGLSGYEILEGTWYIEGSDEE